MITLASPVAVEIEGWRLVPTPAGTVPLVQLDGLARLLLADAFGADDGDGSITVVAEWLGGMTSPTEGVLGLELTFGDPVPRGVTPLFLIPRHVALLRSIARAGAVLITTEPLPQGPEVATVRVLRVATQHPPSECLAGEGDR